MSKFFPNKQNKTTEKRRNKLMKKGKTKQNQKEREKKKKRTKADDTKEQISRQFRTKGYV